jgi:hypothetical protein
MNSPAAPAVLAEHIPQWGPFAAGAMFEPSGLGEVSSRARREARPELIRPARRATRWPATTVADGYFRIGAGRR